MNMDRPMRRSRQRLPPSGLVGLLPQEEAAINRALHESLLQEKKKTTRHRGPGAAQQTHSLSIFSEIDSRNVLPLKRELSEDNTELEGCGHLTEGPSTSALPPKRRRLDSPLSPSHSLDSLDSSPARSSPAGGGGNGGGVGLFGGTSSSSLSSPRSVESSLKLFLSPTSWSRSTSPSWSPTPEPGTTARLLKSSGKSPSKQKKTVKVSEKAKKVVVEVKPKGKRGRPRKYPPKQPTSKQGRGGRPKGTTTDSTRAGGTPKTYTKVALQYHGSKMAKGKVGRGGRVTQGRWMLRPAVADSQLEAWYQNAADTTGVENEATTDGKSSIRSSPYSAQRKFAQNQVPNSTPTRPTKAEIVSRIKEIPKTEDFINFLCLRGSDSMPRELEVFSFPWTQLQRKRSKGGNDVCMRRKALPFSAMKGSNGKHH